MDGKSYSNIKITLKQGKIVSTIRTKELDILYYMRGIVVASARDLVPEMCAAIILPLPLGEESVVIRGSILHVICLRRENKIYKIRETLHFS